MFQRVFAARLETLCLLVASDRQPDLDQVYSVIDEELLEWHDLFEEPFHLVFGREVHHAFDTGPVVPGSIEEGHLAARWELFDITLEIPCPLSVSLGTGSAT